MRHCIPTIPLKLSIHRFRYIGERWKEMGRDTYINATADPNRIEPYVVSRPAISQCAGVSCPYADGNKLREERERDLEE